MRFMKPVIAIAALVATTLTMRMVWSKRMTNGKRTSRRPRRAR